MPWICKGHASTLCALGAGRCNSCAPRSNYRTGSRFAGRCHHARSPAALPRDARFRSTARATCCCGTRACGPGRHGSGGGARQGRLHFRLDGEKLRAHGSWRTSRGDERAAWLLIKRHDEEARPGIDITLEQPESVKRAPKAARRASRAALPAVRHSAARDLVTRPPKTGDWVYEVKHDSYRMLARFSEARSGYSLAAEELDRQTRTSRARLQRLSLDGAWLDGEIVVLHVPTTRASRRCRTRSKAARIPRSSTTCSISLSGRARLASVAVTGTKVSFEESSEGKRHVRFSEDLAGATHEILEHASKLGLEGLIGKQADSVYVAGRTRLDQAQVPPYRTS